MWGHFSNGARIQSECFNRHFIWSKRCCLTNTVVEALTNRSIRTGCSLSFLSLCFALKQISLLVYSDDLDRGRSMYLMCNLVVSILWVTGEWGVRWVVTARNNQSNFPASTVAHLFSDRWSTPFLFLLDLCHKHVSGSLLHSLMPYSPWPYSTTIRPITVSFSLNTRLITAYRKKLLYVNYELCMLRSAWALSGGSATRIVLLSHKHSMNMVCSYAKNKTTTSQNCLSKLSFSKS